MSQRAPSTLKVKYRWLAAVFNAAVTDGVIFRSPCRGVKLPADDLAPVVPLTTRQVLEVVQAMPERYPGAHGRGGGDGIAPG